jgi:hypothetical protein
MAVENHLHSTSGVREVVSGTIQPTRKKYVRGGGLLEFCGSRNFFGISFTFAEFRVCKIPRNSTEFRVHKSREFREIPQISGDKTRRNS